MASQHYFLDSVSRECEAYAEVHEDRFEWPMRLNFQRVASLSLSQVHSLVSFRYRSFELLIIGSNLSFPVCLRRTDFTDPQALKRLESELRRRISNLPDGMSRLFRVDQRSLLLERLLRPPWVCLGFVAALALVHWLVINRVDPHDLADRTRFGIFVPALVTSGDLFRFVSGNFLHRDLSHLVYNSEACLILGWIVEAIIGSRRTVLLLFLSGVVGYSTMLLLSVFSEESQVYLGLGSSAAVWGLLGAVAFLAVRRRTDFPVGFRSPWPIWIYLAWQMFSQREAGEQVAAIHILGGLTGMIFMIVSTRKNRRLPLPRNPKLTPAVVVAGCAIILSAVLVIRNDRLFGSRPYFELLHNRLSNQAISDEAQGYYALVVAVSASAPEKSLQLALERMNEVVARAPSPQSQATLASLYDRVGDSQRAVEIARASWQTSPSLEVGTRLMQFYQSLLDQQTQAESEGENEALSETRIEVSASEIEGGLVFEATLPHSFSETVIVHGLLYRGQELEGLIQVAVEPDRVVRDCVYAQIRLGHQRLSETFVLPVWLHRMGPDEPVEEEICRFQWMLEELRYLP